MDKNVDEKLAVSNTADWMTQQACAMACRCIDKHLVYHRIGSGKRGKEQHMQPTLAQTPYIMRHTSSRPNNLLPAENISHMHTLLMLFGGDKPELEPACNLYGPTYSGPHTKVDTL
jgi:hypothetical protein